MQLGQFLGPPEAHERPSGRPFEIAPLTDRQANLREGGGRQVLPLAGQLLDQLFEPGLCPTIITVPAFSRTVVSSERMAAGQAR